MVVFLIRPPKCIADKKLKRDDAKYVFYYRSCMESGRETGCKFSLFYFLLFWGETRPK